MKLKKFLGKKVFLMKRLKIKSIKKYKSKVYDIEMPSEHNFLLENGAAAHNCSHSVGYGLISYATAYLKHHYPLEWWTSVLSNSTPDEVTEKFWSEICHLIEEPNINTSKEKYELHNGRIIPPINLINGVGPEALRDISAKAPFASLEDFVNRIDGRKTNKKVIINLLKSGAMNVLFEEKMSLKDKVTDYLVWKSLKEGKKQEELPEELKDLNPYKEFLLNKQVLPVSIISLTDAILNTQGINQPFVIRDNQRYLRGRIPLFDGKTLHQTLDNYETLEESVECVSYGYVIAVRNFSYFSEKYSMNKSALELILDFDGYQQKIVCWPRKADTEPILSKYIKEKTFYLFNLKIQNVSNWKFSIMGVEEVKEKII